MGGDGTVPRVSSTPIETDDLQPAYQPMYSSEQHGSLQLAEAVQTQLRGILTARPLTGFRAVQGVRVEADDILATGESLLVTALPDAGGLTLRATVTDVASGRVVASEVLRRDADDVHTGEVAAAAGRRLPAEVDGIDGSEGLADPVHQLVTVVDDIEPPVDPAVE